MDKLVFVDVPESSTKGGSTDLEIFSLPKVEVFRGTSLSALSHNRVEVPLGWVTTDVTLFRRYADWHCAQGACSWWLTPLTHALTEHQRAAMLQQALTFWPVKGVTLKTSGFNWLFFVRFVSLCRLQGHSGDSQRMEQRAVICQRGSD